MRALAAVAAVAVLAVTCGDGAAVEPADLPVARLAGDVCGVPLLAGAVVIDNGLVATAAHVIAGSTGGVTVRLPSGAAWPATVVAFDPDRDLALLAAPGLAAEPLELAAARPGDTGLIVALSRDDEIISVAHQVEREITATGDDIYGEGEVSRRALELAADVEPGMSGGGAYDEDGRLLGIVFAESRERPITYAVTSAEIEALLDETDIGAEMESGRC